MTRLASLIALPLWAALAFGCGSTSDGPSAPSAGAGALPQAGASPSAGGAGMPEMSSAGGAGYVGGTGAIGSDGGASGGAPPAPEAGGGAGLGGSSGASDPVGRAGAGGAVAGSAGAGADAGAGAGAGAVGTIGVIKNPILPGYNADPQIAMFGGKFYIYPTTDGFANWLGTKFHAWSSPDLAKWTDEGVVLDLGPGVSWADDRAWAPGIAFKGGTYYFYFCAGQAIGVATGTSPAGPFKDALGHELVKQGAYGVQAIDPYAFTDDDGRSYLYFGNSSARVVELNADMISFKGTPQTITIDGFREGSVAFKRNGKYYFMYSVGDTRDAAYNVAYGMGTSPMGPFTKATVNPVLVKDDARGILGTGHNSVLAMPNGDYYIAYHRFAIPNGDGTHREVCLDKLEFNSDGTILPVKTTR